MNHDESQKHMMCGHPVVDMKAENLQRFLPPSSFTALVGESICFTQLPAPTNIRIQIGNDVREWEDSTGGFRLAYASEATIKVKLKAKGYYVGKFALSIREPEAVSSRADAPFIKGPEVQ